MGNRRKFWILVWVGLTLSPLCRAETYVFSDLDGVLFGNKANGQVGLNTRVLLFRVQRPYVNSGKDIVTDPVIELPMEDFEKFLPKPGEASPLSNASHRNGRAKYIELTTGKKVMAGDYYFDVVPSYRYFFETPDSELKSWLLSDFEEAVAAHHAQKRDIRGEAFEYFRYFLSDPQLVPYLFVLSARSPRAQEWDFLLENILRNESRVGAQLLLEGDLPTRQIIGVYQPNWRDFLQGNSTAEKKRSYLDEHIKRIALSKSHDSNGMNTVVFIDDTQENIRLAHELFKKHATNNMFTIKFVLWNAGTKSEISFSQRPKISVYQSDGTVKAATVADLIPEKDLKLLQDAAEGVPNLKLPLVRALGAISDFVKIPKNCTYAMSSVVGKGGEK